MPALWSETIETHRAAVRDAVLDTTVRLVAEEGLAAVTMSQIAEAAGISRATLYKYFPDVDAILLAWHERQVGAHLAQLSEVRDRAGNPRERLAAVLEAYALISHDTRRHHTTEVGAFVAQLHRDRHGGEHAHRDHHRGEHVTRARQHLIGFVEDLIVSAAASGDVRDDVPPGELATYCIHALLAAGTLPSKPAVRRLVVVTLAGLHPASGA